MEVYIEYLRGVQFEIKAGQHSLLSDQPVENGRARRRTYTTRTLDGCFGLVCGLLCPPVCKKAESCVEGTRVSVPARKAANPARLNDFLIHVESGVSLTQDQQHGMRQAVEHCLIHNTLLLAPTIRIDIHP